MSKRRSGAVDRPTTKHPQLERGGGWTADSAEDRGDVIPASAADDDAWAGTI